MKVLPERIEREYLGVCSDPNHHFTSNGYCFEHHESVMGESRAICLIEGGLMGAEWWQKIDPRVHPVFVRLLRQRGFPDEIFSEELLEQLKIELPGWSRGKIQRRLNKYALLAGYRISRGRVQIGLRRGKIYWRFGAGRTLRKSKNLLRKRNGRSTIKIVMAENLEPGADSEE